MIDRPRSLRLVLAAGAARVRRERGLDEEAVMALVQANTEQPLLGVLGEARVNVLALNLALDAAAPLPAA